MTEHSHAGPSDAGEYGPDERLSLRAVARLAGVSHTAMRRRYERGDLPPAAGVRPGGWLFWRAGDVREWLQQLSLSPCPLCGSKTKRLVWHIAQSHPDTDPIPVLEGTRPALEWLSTADLAGELSISVMLVRELISSGDLPGRRDVDGSYQVERVMYERWLQRQYQLTRGFIADQPFPARKRHR